MPEAPALALGAWASSSESVASSSSSGRTGIQAHWQPEPELQVGGIGSFWKIGHCTPEVPLWYRRLGIMTIDLS
jgi:hypothetical protein